MVVPSHPPPNTPSAGQNDPVMSSPPGLYVAITTPVLETTLWTNFCPAGMAPSANKRLPEPMTTGASPSYLTASSPE
jgi:hypothetical protein